MPTIPVSNGELCDKVTILIIKSEEISDKSKLEDLNFELSSLTPFIEKFRLTSGFEALFTDLRNTNKAIWDLMEYIFMNFEKNSVEYVDSVNRTILLNKERSYIKKRIDELTESLISETKSYF